MRSAGFATATFGSVDDFLAAEINVDRACVVTDVHMPGISALELPARLRELGHEMPVIFLTGDYSRSTLDRIRESGGQGYFKKPVDDQALIDMIRWANASH
jgi:FixJ family two-component response regulator